MRLYSDLDQTLIDSIVDVDGNVTRIIPRPGVGEFLRKLSGEGEVWLLTAARKVHADRAMRVLEPYSRVFKGIITLEGMEPLIEQVNVIFQEPGLTEQERWDLWSELKPLHKAGVVFDDYPVGSGMFALKAATVGIGTEQWIKVDYFGGEHRDRGGLKKAWMEYKRRSSNTMAGRRRA